MWLDQESSITSKAFRNFATADGVELHFSEAQSHNSISSKDTYHEPLDECVESYVHDMQT